MGSATLMRLRTPAAECPTAALLRLLLLLLMEAKAEEEEEKEEEGALAVVRSSIQPQTGGAGGPTGRGSVLKAL